MRDDYFNPAAYAVTDRITGEELAVDLFIEKVNKGYWEKAYAKTLAEYFGQAGSKATDILAYILVNKDSNNLFHGTWKEVGEGVGVSNAIVGKVFKLAIKKGFITKVRNGKYLISPGLLRHGSNTKGAMILRLWGDLNPPGEEPRKIGKLRESTKQEENTMGIADECF